VRPRTLLALLTAPLATGCLVPRHDGFTTPQEAVLTFQSAYARDDEFREYDCLSRTMKEEQGLTQQIWSTARDRVFEPLGPLGRFVLRRNSLADNLVGGVRAENGVRLAYSVAGRRFDVRVEPEATFVLPDPAAGNAVGWPLTKETAFVDGVRFVVVIEVAQGSAAAMEAEGVPWALLENRWKIAGVSAEEERAATGTLEPLPAPNTRTIRVAAIRPERLGAALGVARLRFVLPLDDGRGGTLIVPGLARASDRFRWEAAAASSG